MQAASLPPDERALRIATNDLRSLWTRPWKALERRPDSNCARMSPTAREGAFDSDASGAPMGAEVGSMVAETTGKRKKRGGKELAENFLSMGSNAMNILVVAIFFL